MSDRLIRRTKTYITAHLDGDLSIKALAARFELTEPALRHRFLRAVGVTIGQYVQRVRMERAAEDLLDGAGVTEVCEKYHFETLAGFCKAFKRRYGVSPQQYKVAHGLPALSKEMKPRAASGPVTKRVADYLRAHPDEDLTPLEAAKRLGISEARFRRSVLDEADVSWTDLTRYAKGEETKSPERRSPPLSSG